MTDKTDQEFYTMEYTCSNCGASFQRQVPKGEVAWGKGGTCPYCGCVDKRISVADRFRYKRPALVRWTNMYVVLPPNKKFFVR
jgi:DNA-directed RNA polymerase subunit RPC12/RpoP